MPIRSVVDPFRGWLVTQADGLLTFHEINAHLDVEQRQRALAMPELFDARGATSHLTPNQVRRLVDRAVEALCVADIGATAIVTTNVALYGMGRMYSLLAARAGILAEVFRDVDTASRWLDQFGLGDD